MFLVLSHERDRSAAIPAGCPLGHDALEPELGRGLKEPGAVALDMIAELDRAAGIRLDQPPEERPPFHERPSPQILAIEVQEIEGKEHQPVRRRVDRRAEGIEVGEAVLVLNDHLAIDDGTLAGQPAADLDHPAVGPRPVIAVPGEGPDRSRSTTIRVR